MGMTCSWEDHHIINSPLSKFWPTVVLVLDWELCKYKKAKLPTTKKYLDSQNLKSVLFTGIWRGSRRGWVWAGRFGKSLRASPPCRVKGSWQALWRGLAEKQAPPLSNPALQTARAFKLPAPLTILAGESCSLLRPYSGLFLDSTTRVKAYRKYSWHLFLYGERGSN